MMRCRNDGPRVWRFGRKTLPIVVVAVAMSGLVNVGLAAQPGQADLRITKTASASALPVGSTLTYTIGVENLGLEPATGVTVTDTLSKDVDYVSATSTSGSCALQARKLTCSIGTLETGPTAKVSSATVTLVVIPRAPGTITNKAVVKADQNEAVTANNEASVSTTVLAPTPVAKCRGVAATVIGTEGPDTLATTGGRDVIVALGGDDVIVSRAGRDLVCAGSGRDFVGAGPAADRVFGGAGRDRLAGRGGGDMLMAGAGSDLLIGGQGADRLRGGAGLDTCRPGPGLDSVRGCER
jgi:uncharacterized repeat protein (TIGR01451 family)